MTVSSAKTRGYMQQAIAAFKKADKPVPNNLNEAADEVRSLDPMLGMQLSQALNTKRMAQTYCQTPVCPG